MREVWGGRGGKRRKVAINKIEYKRFELVWRLFILNYEKETFIWAYGIKGREIIYFVMFLVFFFKPI